jgi:hypothetical protein
MTESVRNDRSVSQPTAQTSRPSGAPTLVGASGLARSASVDQYLASGTYSYEVTRTVKEGLIPGFAGGSDRVSEIVELHPLSQGRTQLVRSGDYWGPYIRYEDILGPVASGAGLIHDIEHYERQSSGSWGKVECSPPSVALQWPIRQPEETSWTVLLSCARDGADIHVRMRRVHSILPSVEMTSLGRRERVIVVRTEVTRYYESPSSGPETRSVMKEWISPSIGLPVRWIMTNYNAEGQPQTEDEGMLRSFAA